MIFIQYIIIFQKGAKIMYNIKKNARHVTMNVLATNNDSLVGLKIGNSEFISMDIQEFQNIIIQFRGIEEINVFYYSIIKHFFGKRNFSLKNNDQSFYRVKLVILETVFPDEKLSDEAENIIDLLKLYKSDDIFSCYWISYQNINGLTNGGGLGHTNVYDFKYNHSINFVLPEYSLSVEEKNNFQKWYKDHIDILSNSCNLNFKQWLRIYFDSFLNRDCNQSYIMLFVILEMIFGDEHKGISNRLSRKTSLFLSSSTEDMINTIGNLYKIRSKYIHNGKEIQYKDLITLREIIRKVIILMYEKGYHKPNFNHKEFLKNINLKMDNFIK